MPNLTNLVIVAPLDQKNAVMATPLNGGWGEPGLSGNGLCAWGVDGSLILPDTLPALEAIEGVQQIPNGGTPDPDAEVVVAAPAKGVRTSAETSDSVSADPVEPSDVPAWKTISNWVDQSIVD